MPVRTQKQIVYHILFWVVYSAIFTFVEGGYGNNFLQAFYIELAFLPFRLFVVYLNYFWLLPSFLLNKNLTKYISYSLLTIILASIAHRVAIYFYLYRLIFPNWNYGSFWQAYQFLQSAVIITSPLIFIIGLTIITRWVSTERRAELLEKEKLKAELSYLRSQINPHFFFNTLNNLYGLALQKSDKTSEVVIKLSELMSYILYEADQEYVSLTKELDQIERYIALEQIRYENRFEVDLTVEGDVDNFQIPPLLLLPFVENSFKHGVNKSSSDGWISILLNLKPEELIFIIKNTIPKQNKVVQNNGLGIVNVKKRLELLFPNRHTIKQNESKDLYVVELTLKRKYED